MQTPFFTPKVGQLPAHSQDHADREAKLLDECRALEAQLYGKRIELAMHNGCRDDANYWRERMEQVIKGRRYSAIGAAERAGQDFFVAAGQHDAQAMRQEPAHG